MNASRTFHIAAATVALVIAGAPVSKAQAELLCDCTRVVDSCSAGVSLDGSRVKIESSSQSCSRVDYLVEGQPFTALIVGGSGELAWPGQPLRNASIVIENCRVCAENTGEPATTATDAPAADATAEDIDTSVPRSLVKVMPAYPREAWGNKIEGDVLVEFSVNQQGGVQNIRVLNSANPAFDVAVIDAVSRFRYAPAEQNGKPTVTSGVRERFYFRLPNGGAQPSVTSSAG